MRNEDLSVENKDHWADEEFTADMQQRIHDFESGKDKGLSWEEVKANLAKKMELIKLVASDPLFLADVNEVANEFDFADNENL